MNDKKPIRVYVAGPITLGDQLTNIVEGIRAGEQLLKLGFVPFVPHAMSALWHMHHPKTHAEWLAYDFAWLQTCDALLRLPGESRGADAEVNYAVEHGIPCFYSVAGLVGHYADTLAQIDEEAA